MSKLSEQVKKEYTWAFESLEQKNESLKALNEELKKCSNKYQKACLKRDIEEMEKRIWIDRGMVMAYRNLLSLAREEEEGEAAE